MVLFHVYDPNGSNLVVLEDVKIEEMDARLAFVFSLEAVCSGDFSQFA